MAILFENATIFDGSGSPANPGDLLIEGDRILESAPPGTMKGRANVHEIIDSTGQWLMPGFIDVHSHSDYHLCIDHRAQSKIRQGVTTEVGGNCGYCAAPVLGRLAEDRRAEYAQHYGIDCGWHGLDEYFDFLSGLGLPLHYAQLIGHNTLRASVMEGVASAPTENQLEQMKRMTRDAMRQGAIGISLGLIYAPGCFAQREELIALCRVVAEEGGIMATHMRSEGQRLVEAVEEVIDVARQARIPLQISHLKTSGQRNWHKLDRVFDLIDQAQQEGVRVDVDRYPYTASYTGLASVLPNWSLEGSRDDQIARMGQRDLRTKMLEEILADHPEGDYWDRIVICQVFNERNKSLEGVSVAEIARRRGLPVIDAICEALIDERMMATAIYHTMSEANLDRILSQPYCMIGSDSAALDTQGPLAQGKSHPRGYGTFPRFLKRVKETGLMALGEAVRRMTSAPAEKFGLGDRGRIAPGMKADLTLIHPDRLDDVADYDDPHRYPDGIVGVWVDGQQVLGLDGPTGALPGKVLMGR